jgi:DNA-binding NarL/FixJ family response regulator
MSVANTAMSTRVVIGVQRDDVRSALRLFVQQEPGMQVVDEAVSVPSLLTSARRCDPDLVIADAELPGTLPSGELVQQVRSSCFGSRIVLLSTRSDDRSDRPGLAQADAVVSTLDSPERLRSALSRDDAGLALSAASG